MSENVNSDEFFNALVSGNAEAQETVVSLYTTQLFRAAIGMGFRGEDADELVQKTWLTFFETLKRFERRSQIRTYLFGILYNHSKNLGRANQKTFKMEQIDTVVEEIFDEKGEWQSRPMAPEKFAQASQDLKNIKECLEDIPTQYRLAFILREIEEESSTEICKILGVSDTNLGVLLYRAKNKLRLCLEKKAPK